ncbi:MAG: hypothetical protein IJH34_01675 [Romboutsia sp.]|nr:hypothetical protein [Romboutsia sp.]
MNNSNKKIKNPISIALYIVSALFGIYTILTIYNSYSYITTLTAQGLVISEELLNVISYFIENSARYIFYAIETWAIGYSINKLHFIANNIVIENNVDSIEDIVIEETSEVMPVEEVQTIEEEIVTVEDSNIDENNIDENK